MPDYEREVSRPNSRERGWNILATPGTYILLAINIAVFGWMVLHGVSPKDPTTAQLDPLRRHQRLPHPRRPVVASAHRDLRPRRPAPHRHQHVVPLEPRPARRAAAWPRRPDRRLPHHRHRRQSAQPLSSTSSHRDGVSVGAGASGAVFGIAGILIVLLSNKKLPIPASNSTVSAARSSSSLC